MQFEKRALNCQEVAAGRKGGRNDSTAEKRAQATDETRIKHGFKSQKNKKLQTRKNGCGCNIDQ
jgi:hypothetical protein